MGRAAGPTTRCTCSTRTGTGRAGVIGKLYVGGAGVARGYLDPPSSPRERFVACPSGGPGARLCPTGDLVRDGRRGRDRLRRPTDDQVNIRGLRIEPGEIEAALWPATAWRRRWPRSFPSPARRRRLAAYLRPACDRPEPRLDELREHLVIDPPDEHDRAVGPAPDQVAAGLVQPGPRLSLNGSGMNRSRVSPGRLR